jgi:hypothetical protein
MKYAVLRINPRTFTTNIISRYEDKNTAIAYAVNTMATNINKGCCSVYIHHYYTNMGQYGSEEYNRSYKSLQSCIRNCSQCPDNRDCGDIYTVTELE